MHDSPEILSKQNGAQPNGLLVVDKPPGPTSYDVIRFLKRTCRIDSKWKIGHLGTLDPFASGVVVVALGRPLNTRNSRFGCTSNMRETLARQGNGHARYPGKVRANRADSTGLEGPTRRGCVRIYRHDKPGTACFLRNRSRACSLTSRREWARWWN